MVPGPGVVGEEDVDLVVGADVGGVELSEPGREGERADEPHHAEGVDEPVLLQDRLDPLVAPQPQHVPGVKQMDLGSIKH